MSRAAQGESFSEINGGRLEQATSWFLRVHCESARVEDLPELKRWMESDPLNERAYRQVAATWTTVGAFGSAPEMMTGRRNALDAARHAARRRWSVRIGMSRYTALAASILIALVGIYVWVDNHRGDYATDVGERRTLTLEDGSAVTLDARSRIHVHYRENERTIILERGQARFIVAKDPVRPFRVRARDQTVIALGTQFNVEIVSDNVLVSLIEGHVAVTGLETSGHGPLSAKHAPPVELTAGEGLRVRADGRAVALPKIDVDRATAWESGKMFFNNEPLANAVERVNRYAKLQIEVDPSVANVGVSGAFNAGDSNAFIEAISTYFPVQVDRTGASTIHLTARK